MLYGDGDVGAEKLIVGPTVQRQSNTIIKYILFDNENQVLKKYLLLCSLFSTNLLSIKKR